MPWRFNPFTGNLDETGIPAFNGEVTLGSATSPSIFFTGDTNTGIYSPGADQLALSTNGTGRLFIDSSGKVGIETSAPAYTFDCRGQGAFELFNDTGGGSVLNLRPSLGDTNKYNMSISSYDHSGGGVGNADGLSINGYDGVSICTGNSTARQERLRVTEAGRVGIGTTSPGVALDVSGNLQTTQRIIVNNAGSSAGITDVSLGTLSGGLWLNTPSGTTGYLGLAGNGMYAYNNDGHSWSVGDSERARIDSSGRLLVGTSSDSGGALLQVNGDRVRIATAKTPASATDTGTAGEACWDANYVYVCTATNTWKRAALSTW